MFKWYIKWCIQTDVSPRQPYRPAYGFIKSRKEIYFSRSLWNLFQSKIIHVIKHLDKGQDIIGTGNPSLVLNLELNYPQTKLKIIVNEMHYLQN